MIEGSVLKRKIYRPQVSVIKMERKRASISRNKGGSMLMQRCISIDTEYQFRRNVSGSAKHCASVDAASYQCQAMP